MKAYDVEEWMLSETEFCVDLALRGMLQLIAGIASQQTGWKYSKEACEGEVGEFHE